MNRKFSVFLIKENIKDPAQILRGKLITWHAPLREGLPFKGSVYFGGNPSNSPDWLSFLQDGVKAALPGIANQSTRAVLLVQVDERYFAFTFGYGRSLLEPCSYVRGFGVKCVLNTVRPDTLMSMDKTIFDEMTVHSRIQTSKGSGMQAFGLDPARDYVRAVTGIPTNGSLGRVISGADALHFSTEVMFDKLHDLCSLLYRAYRDNSYRTHFDWYDNLQLVHDPAQVSSLESELIAAINSRDSNRFHLAPPEIIDWDKTGGFSFTYKGRRNELLQLTDYFDHLGSRHLKSVQDLKRQRVFVWNAEHTETYARWSLYDCIVFETDTDNEKYVLTVGNWFRLDRDFVRSVSDYVRSIEDSTVALPSYRSGDKEGKYNEMVGETAGNMLCLDRKLIVVHTHFDKVEVCDLLSSSGQLIHVKPWRSSSTLSQLFAQARISAELLRSSSEFRAEVREKIKSLDPRFADVIPETNFDPGQFEVVLAIIDSDPRPLDERLPFFSKLNMMHAAKFLRMLGYRVSKLKVAETP